MSPGDLLRRPTSTRATLTSLFVIRIVAGPVEAAATGPTG